MGSVEADGPQERELRTTWEEAWCSPWLRRSFPQRPWPDPEDVGRFSATVWSGARPGWGVRALGAAQWGELKTSMKVGSPLPGVAGQDWASAHEMSLETFQPGDGVWAGGSV